ncbi:hypothetical protein C8R46DRAFT_1083216 [Mycena filopes]|nr:hypothetical protein C8R46DRAFT_1083216 [Mycena filopes]
MWTLFLFLWVSGAAALTFSTPAFFTAGPNRIKFTRSSTDPIGAFLNIAESANASRLANNMDLSVGFVDVVIKVLPGTYSLFAFGNDTDDPGILGTSDDFLVLAATPVTSSSSSSSRATSATAKASKSATAVSGGSKMTPASSPSASSSAKAAPGTIGSKKTPARKPPVGMIVGIVIGVLVILAILFFLFFFFRRRRQRVAKTYVADDMLEAPRPVVPASSRTPMQGQPYASLQVDPFSMPSSSDPSLTSPQQRQQHISNEMRLVRKQMDELRRNGNGNGLSVSSSSPSSSGTSRSLTSPVSSPSQQSDLERSRQQNDALQSRVVELEAQLQSAWAQGLSNEPPPGYQA